MRAALHGSYVEYVLFMGTAERYPQWFKDLLEASTYTDESRFTFWVFPEERRPDYYEKQLIEDYSVILRKSNGDVHITDYETFQDLYITFGYDAFTNSGIAAYEDDAIEYVECKPGVLDPGYPSWFYEYFTEAVNLPSEFNGFMLFSDNDTIEVTTYTVVLRNKVGELMTMPYKKFKRYYDDRPSAIRQSFLQYNHDNADGY